MADAMQVGFRTVDGVRVRCAESTGPSAPSILLTSPWPESVYAPGRPHVVAPDIGSSAALFAAASRSGLLSSVIVESGGAAVRFSSAVCRRDSVGFLLASAAGDPVIGRRHHPSEES